MSDLGTSCNLITHSVCHLRTGIQDKRRTSTTISISASTRYTSLRSRANRYRGINNAQIRDRQRCRASSEPRARGVNLCSTALIAAMTIPTHEARHFPSQCFIPLRLQPLALANSLRLAGLRYCLLANLIHFCIVLAIQLLSSLLLFSFRCTSSSALRGAGSCSHHSLLHWPLPWTPFGSS